MSILILILVWTPLVVQAAPVAFDRYDNVESQAPEPEVSVTAVPPDTILVTTPEDIAIREFNGRVLDTIVYIIGIFAGLMMILQIAVFCWVRIYPSTNRVFEALKKIGIDGYGDGYIFPILKILLLGVLCYLCVTGVIKALIASIIGFFITNFT